jgi:hypothetical protein
VTQEASDGRWVDPEEGFEYRNDLIVIEAAVQREKLAICGLDPALYADTVDPSFFIGLAIRAGVASGISAEGNINMLQTLAQHRPALLGEPLTVRGRITKVTGVPRGKAVETDVWFEDEAGRRVITARRTSLKPDPGGSGRGAGVRPPPVLTDPGAAEVVASHRLTPEIVVGYSEEGNSIHYDMVAANRAGFRAPLIGGGMGVHYLMAALYRERPPETLDLDIYFRRPIFWDDAFEVVRAHDAIALTRHDGNALKVLTEARINALA